MKFNSSTSLHRRAWLQAAGIGVALPWLESLAPRSARAAVPPGAPLRLVYWMIPNGVIDSKWIPSSVGPLDSTNLPESLRPLADAGVAADVNIVSGIDNLCGVPIDLGDHASGIAAMLTCVPAKKTLSDVQLGISVDQVAAQTLGKLTPRPSLELGMAPSGGTGDCDNGYACAYAQSISWVDAKTPRGKKTDPHDAWLYLLGTADQSLTAEQRDRLRRGDKSVLDYVLAQANGLSPKIGVADRAKLDQYFTSVRAMEQQLSSAVVAAECAKQPDPGTSSDYLKRFGLMMDVTEFALKCDLTRVVTFMVGNCFGPGPMPWIGIADDYHALTHRMDQAGVPDQVAKCILWEVGQIATFVQRLKAIPEGSHTVLYNTAMTVTSEIGEGGPHNHNNLPLMIAGNAGGAIATGRHIAFKAEDPSALKLANSRQLDKRAQGIAIPNTNRMSNVHLSLLKAVGVGIDKFADSTGPLAL